MMTKKKIDINDTSAWSDLDWNESIVPEALKRTDRLVNIARANRLKAPIVAEKLRGKARGEDFSKKMSELQKGVPKGPQKAETKQKNRNSNLGRKDSEETLKIKSINAKKQMNDPERKKLNSEQAKNRLAIPENNPNYKGLIYSKNIHTMKIKQFNGPKDFENTEYNYFTVLKRIKSKAVYKDCVWFR